ncbi:MAG: hypothetical protein ACRDKY_11690 [Solirubrobacteraceae bacterium]
MTDTIRAIFLDMPVVDVPGRPEGMLGYMRSEVPPEYREWVDGWVESRGGRVIHEPLIKVHGGTSPEAGPASDGYYALPPAALAE